MVDPNSIVEILLVEDNPDDAELTTRELRRHKLANNLFHVENGQDALDFMFGKGRFANREVTNRPKVILLDIQMPKLNGIEVLKALRSQEATRSVPVVMLTSSKEDPDIRRCYDLGANSYIVKPVNFEGFSSAVRNLGFYWLLLNQSPT